MRLSAESFAANTMRFPSGESTGGPDRFPKKLNRAFSGGRIDERTVCPSLEGAPTYMTPRITAATKQTVATIHGILDAPPGGFPASAGEPAEGCAAAGLNTGRAAVMRLIFCRLDSRLNLFKSFAM